MPIIKYRENADSDWIMLLGSVGPAGPAGPEGPMGPMPEKGVDYMTEADIQEIAAAALALIPSAEEVEY